MSSGADRRQTFYEQRDRRTVEYGAVVDGLEAPVAVVVGMDASCSVAGQMASLALVNMLARVHRHLVLHVPAAKLVTRLLVAGTTTLDDACLKTAHAINPFCRLEDGKTPPTAISIGLGLDVPGGLTWYIGADRFCASLSRTGVGFADSDSSRWGACLAACLGAAAVFRSAQGLRAQPCTLSLWNLAEGGEVMAGPEGVPRVDVGTAAMVGAGAVGSALAYWLGVLGLEGDWSTIDRDHCELHNTNRSLGMLVADTDWDGQVAASKARVAARLIRARPFEGWYEEWLEAERTTRPDLVLPLANGPGLRAHVGQRGDTVILHATTSRSWTGELHRHIAGRDDCIACRLPETAAPKFICSTAPLSSGENGPSGDAALPFLSGSAGLLLAAGLLHLQLGTLVEWRHNHWRLHMELGSRVLQRSIWACQDGCARVVPSAARETINRGRRWAGVR